MTSIIFNKVAIASYFPVFSWLKNYTRSDFNSDWFAGIITAILLIPQGIAYAILAGLPPQLGLYASILPPVIYALLGTSRTLSVGPVSIAAIMIASVLQTPEIQQLGNPVESALILAAACGLIMLGMALFNMGGMVNFISHPVLTGFTSGASLLIIFSQIAPVLGLKEAQCALNLNCYLSYLQGFNAYSLSMALSVLSLLFIFSTPLPASLKKLQFSTASVTAISKCGPLLAVIFSTSAVSYFDLHQTQHLAIVGNITAGFPKLTFSFSNMDKWRLLLPSAAFIALIAYVESVAIAKVTANLRGEKISPNQELIALGCANLTTAVSGGMPVAGGFSRTMVNFSAGAKTQMAMLIAASILSLAVMYFSAWFTNIPKAALAAIILMAILPLVKLRSIVHTWRYDPGDGLAELATLVGVLSFGIEQGIALGIALTIISFMRKSSQPHIAVVGRIPATEHFRNIKRHQVETFEQLLLLRVDDNITFANIDFIEKFLLNELKLRPDTRHVVLIFTSVSDIDMTALEALENLNQSIQASGLTLHLAETKGPVLDKLAKTDFLAQLKPGKVFFRTQDAVTELTQ